MKIAEIHLHDNHITVLFYDPGVEQPTSISKGYIDSEMADLEAELRRLRTDSIGLVYQKPN